MKRLSLVKLLFTNLQCQIVALSELFVVSTFIVSKKIRCKKITLVVLLQSPLYIILYYIILYYRASPQI